MRVLIVGPGAIGLSLYYAISRSFDAWLGVLERHLSIVKKGVEIVLPSGVSVALKPKVLLIEPEAPRLPPFDLVLLAVKMHSLSDALRQILPCVGIDTAIATVQNGWDPHGMAIRVYGYRAVHVLLTLGAKREGNRVIVSSWGRAFIGSRYGLTRFVRMVERVFRASGIGTRIVTDIDGWTWLKLAVNAAINPLTAILRVENGALINSYLNMIAHEVVEEVRRIARRCLGIELPEDPHEMLDSVIRETSRNKSSMLQDIEAGRRTEVDFINGAIHRTAVKCGESDKVNSTLLNMVKYLEKRSV